MSLDSLPISLSSNNESENKTNELTFHDACTQGNLRVVKIYLSRQGFDMNVGDKYGFTGFILACCFGNLNVVQFLIRQGCDMNVGNNYGNTGFHLACCNGHLNVVQFLVRYGFDMNVSDDAGRNGFHLACHNGNLNVVQFLLRRFRQEFDMNVGDNYGRTGFHSACLNANRTGYHSALNKHLNVVQFLVRQGFDMNARDNQENTALDILIEEERFLPCALFLIEAGATLNENDVFEELISAIQNRIIEITFTEQTIFEKWTGRIARAITDFTMDPYTNTSLQNLSQILD